MSRNILLEPPRIGDDAPSREVFLSLLRVFPVSAGALHGCRARQTCDPTLALCRPPQELGIIALTLGGLTRWFDARVALRTDGFGGEFRPERVVPRITLHPDDIPRNFDLSGRRGNNEVVFLGSNVLPIRRWLARRIKVTWGQAGYGAICKLDNDLTTSI